MIARAVALLARREHSRAELGRKLQRSLEPGDDPAVIAPVLDQLEADGLLSDARFAASLVRRRAPRYGDRRVARDLHDKGVTGDEAAVAMAALADSEAVRALDAWSRRFDALPTTADERGRQGRYLETRGFSIESIRLVLAGKVTRDS